MGILSTKIEIALDSKSIKYYEERGYSIPRTKNKQGKYTVPKGTRIIIDIKDLPRHSGLSIDVECDCCHKQYKVIKQNYERTRHGDKIYCRSCAKKIFNSNINHPLYKKEITMEERENGRFYPEYIDFIKRVLARDNYTCQCCNKTKKEVKLQVHHLYSYNLYKEKRTDDTNGITLCETCHSNFHSIYGKGNNTKEQFDEWLGSTLEILENYNGEISSARKIYCYEEDKIYFSVKEFCKMHNIDTTSCVYNICNNVPKYYSVNGLHVFWYDEYIHMKEDDIMKRIHHTPIRNNSKKVICLNTKVIYNSIKEASKKTGVHKNSISNCCNRKQQNTYSTDGTIFQWMFLDEYLDNLKEQIDINNLFSNLMN